MSRSTYKNEISHPPSIVQYFRFFIMSKKRRSKCSAPQKSFLAACSKRNRFQSLASKCFPCSSPRSEHGILGKRRVKLRSPAVGRTPRGCQPDKQFRPRLSGTLWSAAVRVRGSRAQRRGRLNDSTDFNRWQHARVLARAIARGRGVWTLVGASVECRVMSGATIAGGDETR